MATTFDATQRSFSEYWRYSVFPWLCRLVLAPPIVAFLLLSFHLARAAALNPVYPEVRISGIVGVAAAIYLLASAIISERLVPHHEIVTATLAGLLFTRATGILSYASTASTQHELTFEIVFLVLNALLLLYRLCAHSRI
jgi:hypothetical protein